MRWLSTSVVLAAVLAGCGGTPHRSHVSPRQPTHRARPTPVVAGTGRAPRRRPVPQALVTAETENRLVIVDLRSGAVTRRIAVPGGPQYVAAEPGAAVATSPAAGAISLLTGRPLHVIRVLRGFGSPHIVEISPDGRHAYVTDDQRGTLTVLQLSDGRVASTIHVGAGAHHLGTSPDQRRIWIALGESARTIVIVDTSDLQHPRVIRSFDPGFPAHDLAFSPDGRRVWIASAAGADVSVFRAADDRLLFRVPVGPPPQHIAFAGADAYLTSGYGKTIERVLAATGRVIRRSPAPYGSFELDAADGFVATASLLDGRLAVYTPQLGLRHVRQLAPDTRDVAIWSPDGR